jgi:uncharacterized protein (DUF2225 family)
MAIIFREFTVVCPNCEHKFQSRAVTSVSPAAQRGTDFHDRYREGQSVLPYQVHLCDQCGFCAEEKCFVEPLDKTFKMALGDFIYERLTPNLRWAREYLVDRFEHALKIAEFSDESPMQMGDIALRGAWAAVEERDPESERFFRRIAVQNYTTALQHYDMVDRAQRANVTYLIGELWRRLGDEPLAIMWFDAVHDAIVDTEQEWLVKLAIRQKTTPMEYL